MRRILSVILLLCLGVFLVGCNKANKYDFVYELSVHNYDKLINIDIETVKERKYIKYDLKNEGHIESLIVTVKYGSGYMATEENITLKKEGESYLLTDVNSLLRVNTSISGCIGTLYSNHFKDVFGFSLNKAKSDVKELNESLEAYNEKLFYTVESEVRVLDVRMTYQIGYRNDPFYFYTRTPFDVTAYTYDEEFGVFTKKFQSAKKDTFTYLTESELFNELGIDESSSFGFPETMSVYKDAHGDFYIIGHIKDLKGSFFPEDTFNDVSDYSEFKMSVDCKSRNELVIEFDILNDDVVYEFVFEYDFTTFGDIEYLFD